MIAADTCSLIAYFQGKGGDDVETIDQAMQANLLILPPVVATEILSDPKAGTQLSKVIEALPLIEPTRGFFYRAGALRAIILKRNLKANVADALIAQREARIERLHVDRQPCCAGCQRHRSVSECKRRANG